MSSEKIKIRMEAYDHDMLDKYALELVETAKNFCGSILQSSTNSN